MRLTAIANIVSNSNKTIGFRLIDSDTKQTKDVPLNNIKSVLAEGKLQIDNLSLKHNTVIGSNGTIDRLPKVADGQLIGRSALIILSQLDDGGYKVSDYKGTVLNMINTDILKYAKVHGIANGKVVYKDGKEFISSIDGTYAMENTESKHVTIPVIEKKTRVLKNKGLYTGDYITDISPLLPIITSGIARTSKYNISIPEYYILSCKDGKFDIEKNENMLIEITRDEIKTDMVPHTNKYTLGGNVFRGLNINNKEHLNDIKELLRITQVRDNIDQAIITLKQRREGRGGKIDAETELYLPTSQLQYFRVVARENVDKDMNSYDNTPDNIIQKYLKYLSIMTSHIYGKIDCSSTKLALTRKCNSKGIDYKVIQFTDYYWRYSNESVENIYEHSKEYDNIIVEDSKIKIIGLDGAYSYDINTLHKEYNRFEVKSNRSLKASLVDPTYKEVITARGELKYFSNGLANLIIPNNVKDILRRSIRPTRSNTIMIFGDAIENCSSDCFDTNNTDYNFAPKYIEIGCNNKAGLGVVKSLTKIESSLRNTEIAFTRDITPKEYAQLLFSRYIGNNAKSNKLNNIDDEFITATIKEMITSNLDNLKILSKPIEFEYDITENGVVIKADYMIESFKYQLDKFKSIWEDSLKHLASKKLTTSILEIIDKSNKQVQFRQAELKENIARVESKYGKR